ncbi:MAG TPA: hypothetical protein VJM31_15270 [Vicinamibacterales bacterium]|nr:hypothetical protein [Vicinamibacterales bacterium]
MTRIAVCMALCASIGCGSSSPPAERPVTPLTPAPVAATPSPLTGTWTGMFDVSSCTGSVDWCRGRDPESFSLTLDATLRGVAEIGLWRRQPLAVDVVQSQGTGGSTVLKGVSTVTTPQMDLEIQLEGSASSGLTGTVLYAITGDPYGEPKSTVVTRSGPILFIRPVTTVRAGALQGMWRGYAKRTACSGDCDSGRTREVNFWFSQQGSNLLASFQWGSGGRRYDLEGTAAGREFTLTRKYSIANCPATYHEERVCQDSFDFQGSVDSLNRMRGTFQQREAGLDYDGRPYSWTATFELDGVVRVQ